MHKQHGNTLLILLVLLGFIAMISMSLYEISLLHFKISRYTDEHLADFYQTEKCLQNAITQIRNAAPPSSMIAVSNQPIEWWQQHGAVCDANKVWTYQQTRLQIDDNSFVQITAYHRHHIIIQSMVKLNQATGQTKILNWANIVVIS
jgi:Tfp pilus assembly protein PilX